MGKKVLSLDGGGTWAVLQVMALKEIYKDVKPVGTNCRKILNEFDVIAANSGGSLVLAGLIEKADEDIDEVIKLFLDEELRKSIFSKLTFWDWNLESLSRLFNVGPKYKAKRKITGLEGALKKSGKIRMCELREKLNIRPHIVLTSFDYDLRRGAFFKTAQDESNYDYTLAQAVNASTNAPVNYFDKPVSFNYDHNTSHQYWDGAVAGNNNPVLIGITEALRIFDDLKRTSEDIKVLSIGNSGLLLPVEGFTDSSVAVRKELILPIGKSNLARDMRKLSLSIISEPPDAANFMAHMLLGGNETVNKPRIIRMNPMIQPVLKEGKWRFPEGVLPNEEKDFLALTKYEIDALKQFEMDNIVKFGNWWLTDKVVNQSIRYSAKTFQCKIGHSTFSSAKSEWLNRTV
ncbi:MAG: patatin-like phospholipase family protein [Sporocytophaga sp.]|uniref:patatin-like phospholipase family protein n=1 Tax=Sporocytophaga sp. TaxID=2231183 RepID=UPI001B0D1F53|nr:patatin-like phospholipase family protein [Sporocytophaga sp.]MBO9700994.1 patatin-like phospholipase family protein [Sporocytophaga sp.]